MDQTYGQGENTPPSPSDAKKPPDPKTDQDQKGTETEGKSGEPGGKKDAETRINQLVGQIKNLEEKLEQVGSKQPTQPVPGQEPPLTPELERAREQIKSLKFVDEEALDKKVRQMEDRILLDTEHGRLEKDFDGEDGRPKYERKEVEKFMRDKGVYNPEIAYENLFKTELLDWNIKNADKKPAPPKSDSGQAKGDTQKGDTQTITREVIREKMSTPEWKSFYDQNRDTILTLMQKGQLS